MVVLDISIVNVALPDMQRDLQMSQNGLACEAQRLHAELRRLPAAGRPGRRLVGTMPAVLIGVALFSLTSLLGRLARNCAGLQGLGGAVLSPATLTILTTAFTDPRTRPGRWGCGAQWPVPAARRACSQAAC
jgi:MFS family permease